MLFAEIVARKRDGHALRPEEIARFVEGLADGSLPAEQIAALAMAICLKGMTAAECAALTRDMAQSGRVLDWRREGLDGPVVDKHSTGGIGDKVSLILAPMAAACGLYVPMISGRGLGHTGGTLDKLESIPGYQVTPDADQFRRVVREIGCAIIGQTADLAPADRRLYAIRDITATVESVPLITASILSKKLAAGLEALVLDVKTGRGAFMGTLDDARRLAASLVGAARETGLCAHALVTDMNAPLGRTAGNALEVHEAIACLRNDAADERLVEVCVALVAEMLIAGGVHDDGDEAREAARASLAGGAAAERFEKMVAALGGPADLIEHADRYLPAAKVHLPVASQREGYLAEVDTRAIGHAIIALGGGRTRATDGLDAAVGFSELASPGERVDAQRPLGMVHAASADAAAEAARALQAACRVDDSKPAVRPLIHERLTPENLPAS